MLANLSVHFGEVHARFLDPELRNYQPEDSDDSFVDEVEKAVGR